MKQILLVLLASGICVRVGAQVYDTNNGVVQTFAGSGFYGYVDGQGTQTMFDMGSSSMIVADSSGNLFVWDSGNYRIRKIAPDATVSTFAGGGTGSIPGYGTNISLNANLGGLDAMAFDHLGELWILAGRSLLRVGNDTYVLLVTNFSTAYHGLCFDSGNNAYLSDWDNKIYRYRTNGFLELMAGSGNAGSKDGNGIFTSFFLPTALTADAADNIYVWDTGDNLLRRINQNKDVVTIAGKNDSNLDGVGRNASFGNVNAMCFDDSGNLLLAGSGRCVRKMTAATIVVTIAGSFTQPGYNNGPGSQALFGGLPGLCVSQGVIFVCDDGNQRIRSISFSPQQQPVLPADLQLSTYSGLQITGTVGRTYRIESSPDMSIWNTVTTLLLTSSPYLWIDQNPVSGKKFYRAFLLP